MPANQMLGHLAHSPSSVGVIADTPPPPERGKLLTNSAVGQLSTNQVRSIILDLGASGFVTPRFAITLLRFSYETADPFGVSIRASALLVFPQGVTEPFPLVGLQHGTAALKNIAPSQSGQSSARNVGIAFATLGYVAVVSDYLGLGDSPGYQTHSHARSEATCVVDALRAARTLCVSNQVALNGQLFLYGYSQGGHATMSTHRESELSQGQIQREQRHPKENDTVRAKEVWLPQRRLLTISRG